MCCRSVGRPVGHTDCPWGRAYVRVLRLTNVSLWGSDGELSCCRCSTFTIAVVVQVGRTDASLRYRDDEEQLYILLPRGGLGGARGKPVDGQDGQRRGE